MAFVVVLSARTERGKRMRENPEDCWESDGWKNLIWIVKSGSDLPKNDFIQFRLSGFYSSLRIIHFRYGPNTFPHYTRLWHKTYQICVAPLPRSARRCYAPLQKSRQNHRSYVWAEAWYGFRAGAAFLYSVNMPKWGAMTWKWKDWNSASSEIRVLISKTTFPCHCHFHDNIRHNFAHLRHGDSIP